MANYILASVGDAQGFREVNGKMYQVLSAKTLTDSSLSLTSTMEEIRAGQGAKLYGRFSHDTGMTANLTDAMFKMEYIALQTGSNIESLGATCMYTEQLKYGTTGFTLTSQPEKMGKSCGLDHVGIWFKEVGCNAETDYTFYELTTAEEKAGQNIIVPGMPVPESEAAAKTYCVTYFKEEAGAREMLVNANFIPSEMILFLTANLYAGDSRGNKTGSAVGKITIKIPRFQLDGAVDLSMAMSSASTFNLTGTALATDAESCNSEGVYCEIVEIITGRNWYDGLRAVEYDSESTHFYGIFNGGHTNDFGTVAAPIKQGLVLVAPTTEQNGSAKYPASGSTFDLVIPKL